MEIVRDDIELTAVRRVLASACGVPYAELRWPPPPTEYPCLVMHSVRSANQVLACYVYREDAQRLCAVPPTAATDVPPPSGMPQEWRDYFDRIVAIVMANVDFLVGVGICTRASFEAKVATMQALLDQDQAERKDLERCLRRMEA